MNGSNFSSNNNTSDDLDDFNRHTRARSKTVGQKKKYGFKRAESAINPNSGGENSLFK